VGLVVGVTLLDFVPDVTVLGFPLPTVMNWLEVLAVAGFVLQLPLGPLLVRLDYEMRWYIVTDRSLRIREGILHVREQTMTFSNIQNLSIQQGPVQRLFGIEDLKVRTAGGGESEAEQHGKHAAHENMHEGFFRGVRDAASIRDAILVRLKGQRDTGLGETGPGRPASRPSLPPVDLRGLLDAARELRDEAANLRGALDG
jgi:membrane protein YdbS with pleckstrin-like domain